MSSSITHILLTLTPPTTATARDGTIRVATAEFLKIAGFESLPPGTTRGSCVHVSAEEISLDDMQIIVTFTNGESADGTTPAPVMFVGSSVIQVEVVDAPAETAARRRAEMLNRELAAKIEDASRKGIARRLRTAAVLHNDVLQRLAAIQIAVTASPPTANREYLTAQLGEIGSLIRSELSGLYTAPVLDMGYKAAIEALADRARESGLQVELNLAEIELGEGIEELLYRSAQEILRNVVVHAAARRCWVTLEAVGDMVVFTVADDGRGFALTPARDLQHFGLLMLDEGVEAVGGSLKLYSNAATGVTVIVTLPRSRPL